jgi:hypothetical protein
MTPSVHWYSRQVVRHAGSLTRGVASEAGTGQWMVVPMSRTRCPAPLPQVAVESRPQLSQPHTLSSRAARELGEAVRTKQERFHTMTEWNDFQDCHS